MNDRPQRRAAGAADVALLLEGTYPFVRGGVSSWVHQIVSALDDVHFSLVFIGSRRADYGEPAYPLPPNVTGLTCHYLFDPIRSEAPRRLRAPDEPFRAVERFHDEARANGEPVDRPVLDALLGALDAASGIRLHDLLRSDRAWRRICESYARECPDGPFVDFFWTIRTMHAAVFGLAELSSRLPRARSYHSVSTGYAGFLGALLKSRSGRPLVLTEHGIYTKERKIDLSSAASVPGDGEGGEGFGRRLWIRFFEGLGRIAYAQADPVIALYEGNRLRQIQDGAPPEHAHVIPNGVDVERFRPLRSARPALPPPVVGLLGRVVPIKDIKTFIRAMKALAAVAPEMEGWIIGPTDEDAAYHAECVSLAAALGVAGRVKFVGFAPPEQVLPRLGLLALTSISEALPLVVIEAFASGLPVVATDVGACRELIEGRTAEDRALGAGGAVVPIADPEATAGAVLALLRDPARWRAAQQAGIRRVETHYTRGQMVEAYRRVYRGATEWPA